MRQANYPIAVTLLVLTLAGGTYVKRRQLALSRLSSRVDSLAVTVNRLTESLTFGVTRDSVQTSAGDVIFGSLNARVAIIEFTDYECPYCRQHALTVLPILREYVGKGVIRYAIRDYPLPSHPNARLAANVARCAASSGEVTFWSLHDSLFAKSPPLSAKSIENAAIKAGLTTTALQECSRDVAIAKAIDNDLEVADILGVRSTPSFIVGVIEPDGTVRGKMMSGAKGVQVFDALIKQAMARSKQPDGS